MRGFSLRQRFLQLDLAEVRRRRDVGTLGLRVLDQVAVERLAVADGRLERDRILDEVDQLLDALLGEARLLGELCNGRVTVHLLGERAARAHDASHLLRDVDRQADRAALVGERAGDRLADPPRRVRRKLEAHPVVEFLDCADKPQVALLDQVQERDAGLRVIPCDRHDQAQVAFDQLPLRGFVARVLAAREIALFVAGEQRGRRRSGGRTGAAGRSWSGLLPLP